jgi:hypothetical protein
MYIQCVLYLQECSYITSTRPYVARPAIIMDSIPPSDLRPFAADGDVAAAAALEEADDAAVLMDIKPVDEAIVIVMVEDPMTIVVLPGEELSVLVEDAAVVDSTLAEDDLVETLTGPGARLRSVELGPGRPTVMAAVVAIEIELSIIPRFGVARTGKLLATYSRLTRAAQSLTII